MEFDEETNIYKTENFVETLVDDELVLLHIINGKFFSLKDTGRRAWELLDTNPRFGTLLDAMVLEYDVDPARCRLELASLLADLEARTLLQSGRA